MFSIQIKGRVQMKNTMPFLNHGSTSFNEQIEQWSSSINGFAPTISFLFNAIFTIMFLFGAVRLGYSMVTKTGQAMKFSTGLLIWVPITVFFIRIFILFIFTLRDAASFAEDLISLLQYIGYYFSVGMILTGLVFFLFHKLINHPEFGRWGKRLWGLSGILVILVTIMPQVLGAA
ncbi:MAG: hypothetical protein BAA00_18275 [Parageobacillus thermoglucosidasius]|nr:MAG: hypothetical protein BAA00_18275 [Parageobacillus thermoglucosidasius]